MELRNFFLQMETQIGSGIPLLRALTLVSANASGSFRRKVEEVARRVDRGAKLSEAMAAVGSPFLPLHIAFVRFGEESGTLDRVFGSLSDHAEGEARLTTQMVNAMIYPGFVLMVALVAGPVVQAIQGGQTADTAILPAILNLVFLALVIGVGWGVLRMAGGGSLDKILIQVPIVGGIMHHLALARFTRALAIGQKAGVPLMQAMGTAIEVSGNAWLQQRLRHLPSVIGRGKRIGDAMAGIEGLPSTLTEMIRTGEESGRLPEMLEKTAAYFEQEAATRIARFNAIFPTLVFLLVAAYAVIWIILPAGRQIFDLNLNR